jgi:hypothetical protein
VQRCNSGTHAAPQTINPKNRVSVYLSLCASLRQVVRVLAAFDFLVMLVLSNVIHDFDVARVPIVDKPDAIR